VSSMRSLAGKLSRTCHPPLVVGEPVYPVVSTGYEGGELALRTSGLP
jgi:hypothetical protein